MTSPNDVPVGQPLPGAPFGLAVKRFFQGYVRFSGRASRSEYWWAQLFVVIVLLVPTVLLVIASVGLLASVLAAASSPDPEVVLSIAVAGSGGLTLLSFVVVLVSLPLILPTYSSMWRRLQDAGFHGAFSLLSLVGLSIVPLALCIFPGSPEGIRFDPAYRAQLAAQQGYGATPYGAPGYGPAGYGAAGYGAAGYGTGAHGSPAYGPPAYGPPAEGSPAYGTSAPLPAEAVWGPPGQAQPVEGQMPHPYDHPASYSQPEPQQ
ncbi:DUF805 domain-containing protein [Agrococcus sp. 1P02AA]|uniref:DUF805 domain-containing protein n=1 Tax=Agrococcus sp. 1P02AA TaxID=3132259 RepID=UPI0039A48B26